MSKVILGIGLFLTLIFIMTVYTGYNSLMTAASTLTSSVKNSMAVMVASSQSTGGGYVNEGYGADALQLNLSSLTQAVANSLPTIWSGSLVTVKDDESLQWTLPSIDTTGYHIDGPITISPIAESASAPPTLTTTVSIPVAVNALFASWEGTLKRTIILPLVGQTGPDSFVPYNVNWLNEYQSSWAKANTAAGAVFPGSTPTSDVPNGLWFASNTFSVSTPGVYQISVSANDAAVLYLDGEAIATTSANANPNGTTVSVALAAGPHVLNAEVSNNSEGTTAIVPDNSGSPNPSALTVTVTDPSGSVVDSTGTQTWTIDPYPSSPPTGATTSGNLP